MNWIHCHQNELQAISGLAIAILTVILIFVTAVYATANWRTMRLVEADVKFRTRPIPRLGLTAANAWDSPGGQMWTLTLRSEHAPLCLVAVSIGFVTGANEIEYFHSFNREIIELGRNFQHDFQVQLPLAATSWILHLYYRDHAELLDYGTTFGQAGFVSELPPINRRTLWNRVQFLGRRTTNQAPDGDEVVISKHGIAANFLIRVETDSEDQITIKEVLLLSKQDIPLTNPGRPPSEGSI